MKKMMLVGLGAMVLLVGCGAAATENTGVGAQERGQGGRGNFAQNRRGPQGMGGGMGSSTML